MARYRGTFTAAANYEPLKAAPFDARQLVDTKADLINPATWQQINGDIWIYSGMLVVVCADTQDNNGLYILVDRNIYNQEKGWMKLAEVSQITALEEKIQNIPTIDNIQVIYGGDSNVANA